MRGLAAIAVLVSHLRNIFFVDYSELSFDRKNVFVALIYFITDLGHQAVIIFFVLSGFLIAGSVMKSELENRWSWRVYLISRSSRLYVVLIPALLLGYTLDRTGIAVSGGSIYAGHSHNHVVEFSVAQRANWLTLIGNALFLQEILVKPLGSNAALWSLSYEFWYYLIFPLLLFAILSKRTAVRCLSAAAAALILLFVGTTISLYFLVWLTGAIVNLFPRSADRRRSFFIIAAVLFFSALVVSRTWGLASGEFIGDLLLGLASATLIYAMLGDHRHILSDGTYPRVAAGLAGFSYTLYLVHLPLLVLIKSVLDQMHRWQPTATTAACGIFVGIATLIYAAIVAYITEHRTDVVRRRLTRFVELVQDILFPPRRQPVRQPAR